MADGKDIIGAGGGGDKKQRQPIEAPDSLHSVAYARVDDVVSEGPIVGLVDGLKSVYFNETPVENADGSRNFQRFQVDWRWGTQDQDPIPGFGTVENEIGVGVELRAATAWTQAINNPALDGIRIRLSVPMLTKTDTSTGDTNGNSVEYAIDIATDGGAFVEVLATAITGKTTSKYERSHRLDLPKALTGWVVRVRRLTADSTSGTNISASYIESYTELVDAKLAYPNTAHITSQVDASQFQSVPQRAFHLKGRIIRVPSNYDPETRAYTGLWDGTFKTAYTNNPAWIFYDLVTHKRYGLGHLVDAAQVNKWALYSIARWCDEQVPDGQGGTEPRLTCNVYLQTQEDAYKVLSDLAGAFRGVAYWAAGAIQPSADMPADPVYIYTPANVVDGKFEYSGSGRRARHTVALVSWNDIRDFGRSKVEYVEDLDGIARYGINQTEIISIGCTSRSQARRHGKMVLATERLETDLVTFRIGLDGTFSAPGQIIQIADPLRMGDRLGGRISSATANTITVDRLPETLPVAGDTLNVIGTDGKQSERVLAAVDEATRTLTVTVAFDTIPVPHSMWMVERTDLSAPMYRVLAVTEEGDGVYGITALLHRPDKYAFVDNNEPLEPVPLPLDTSVTPVETITVSRFDRTTEYATETVVAADWERPTGALEYDVQWRKDEGEWIKQPRQVESRIEITNARPGSYLFRVAAVNAFGKPSLMRYSDAFVVLDNQPAPVAIVEVRQSVADEAAARAQGDADALATAAADATAKANAAKAEATARANALQAQINDVVGTADDWAATAPYPQGDSVRYSGHLYRAKVAVPANTPPPNATYWEDVGNYASVGEAVAATVAKAQQNASAIAAEVQRVDGIVVRLPVGNGALASSAMVADEATARANADGALSQRTGVIEGRMPTGNDKLANEARVVNAETASVGRDDALAQRALALETKVNDPATGLAQTASVVQAMTAEVHNLKDRSPNLLVNGGFDYGVGDWSFTSGFGWSSAWYGKTLVASPSAGTRTAAQDIKVAPGATYTISGEVGRDSDTGDVYLTGYWIDAAGSFIAWAPSLSFSVADNWQRKSLEIESPANGATFRFVAWVNATTAAAYFRKLKFAIGTDTVFSDETTAKAQYVLAVMANGKSAGMKLASDGTVSDIDFLADHFRVSTEDGYGLALDKTKMDLRFTGMAVYQGNSFGPDSLGFWIGPNTIAKPGATKANAAFWVDYSGQYGGGSAITGSGSYFQKETAASNTLTATTVSFPRSTTRAAREITAVLSMSVQSTKYSNDGTGSSAFSTPFVVEVSRDGGAWTQLDAQGMCNGTITRDNSEPGITYYEANGRGSIVAYDTGGGTNLQYRARETGSMPSVGASAIPNRTISIKVTEI